MVSFYTPSSTVYLLLLLTIMSPPVTTKYPPAHSTAIGTTCWDVWEWSDLSDGTMEIFMIKSHYRCIVIFIADALLLLRRLKIAPRDTRCSVKHERLWVSWSTGQSNSSPALLVSLSSRDIRGETQVIGTPCLHHDQRDDCAARRGIFYCTSASKCTIARGADTYPLVEREEQEEEEEEGWWGKQLKICG